MAISISSKKLIAPKLSHSPKPLTTYLSPYPKATKTITMPIITRNSIIRTTTRNFTTHSNSFSNRCSRRPPPGINSSGETVPVAHQ